MSEQWTQPSRVRRAKRIRRASPTSDSTPLELSPLSAPASVQTALDCYADADDYAEPTQADVAKACGEAIETVTHNLRELQNQPALYYQARAIAYSTLADRWMVLAASYQSDIAIANTLTDMALKVEKMALQLSKHADKITKEKAAQSQKPGVLAWNRLMVSSC